MMKHFIITALMMGFYTAGAQVKISGHITDNRNKSVTRASIVLKKTYDGATADSSGFYSFVTEEKGTQQIEVTISGYNTVVQNIIIGNTPINLDITLKEQVTELKAV